MNPWAPANGSALFGCLSTVLPDAIPRSTLIDDTDSFWESDWLAAGTGDLEAFVG
jgi:hypothetical protein